MKIVQQFKLLLRPMVFLKRKRKNFLREIPYLTHRQTIKIPLNLGLSDPSIKVKYRYIKTNQKRYQRILSIT